jgi:FixJ family two-component response regulator
MAMGQGDGRVVCIVDDDASLRRSLGNLLMSLGFRVETFPSGEAFLATIDRDRVGCLVLDVRMEGMSGVELLRRLATAGPAIPTVMLTAHSDDETRRRSLEAGALAFLRKPVRSDALLAAVRAAFASPRD